MNVTLDKTDNVSAVLNVSIEENDYKPEVEKKLKEIYSNNIVRLKNL